MEGHPAHPHAFYTGAGTGSESIRANITTGRGVCKSTDFGLFVSFDSDGRRRWQPHQRAFPVTPITDIRIQRKDLANEDAEATVQTIDSMRTRIEDTHNAEEMPESEAQPLLDWLDALPG